MKDGMTITTSGFVGSCMPEALTKALEQRFLTTNSPQNLTFVYSSAQGNHDGSGADHVAHEGMTRRVIGGHWNLAPQLGRMVLENKIEGYNLPQGVLCKLYRDIASRSLGHITHVGIGTFVDPRIEGEEGDASNEYGAGDKAHLNLPGLQQKLLEKDVAVGKPTILVLSSGSALAVNFAQDHCSAIVQNWYAGSYGGQAVAELLFGKFSPSGRLPVTFYKSLDDLPAFTDYAMEGRTYRYLHAEPLYPFGYGLSYAKFTFSDLTLSETSLPAGEGLRATVTVQNESGIPAATPVEFYVRDEEASTRVPHFSLCAFDRVELAPGESRTVTVEIAPRALCLVTEAGEVVEEPGDFTLFAGASAPDARSVTLTGAEPLRAAFRVI